MIELNAMKDLWPLQTIVTAMNDYNDKDCAHSYSSTSLFVYWESRGWDLELYNMVVLLDLTKYTS